MVRVDATPVAAEMVDLEVVGDRAVSLDVGETVCIAATRATVAVRAWIRPDDAVVKLY